MQIKVENRTQSDETAILVYQYLRQTLIETATFRIEQVLEPYNVRSVIQSLKAKTSILVLNSLCVTN